MVSVGACLEREMPLLAPDLGWLPSTPLAGPTLVHPALHHVTPGLGQKRLLSDRHFEPPASGYSVMCTSASQNPRIPWLEKPCKTVESTCARAGAEPCLSAPHLCLLQLHKTDNKLVFVCRAGVKGLSSGLLCPQFLGKCCCLVRSGAAGTARGQGLTVTQTVAGSKGSAEPP